MSLFSKIKSYFFSGKNNNEPEKIEESLDDDDEKIVSICYSLTSGGSVYIDIENTDENLSAIDLATIIFYSGSYSGQFDTLEIIKENMIENEKGEYLEKFLYEYGNLKATELMSVAELSNKPCIDPLDML